MIKDGGKIKISTYFYILFVLFIMCVGGYLVFFWPGKAVTELGKLAYDVNPRLGYEIYLKEGEAYVPYLVLTDDYDGNVLLLRKELLPESRSFLEKETHGGGNGFFSAYYATSGIDRYLNAEFIDHFGESLKNEIVDSSIIITAIGEYKFDPEKTITIERKVFLLSLVELDITNYYPYTSAYEGKPLKYFEDSNYERRYAKKTGYKFSPYWTRTPEIWENYVAFTIGIHGLGAGDVDLKMGVRPAFCLKRSTQIIQTEDVVAGKEVYILK